VILLNHLQEIPMHQQPAAITVNQLAELVNVSAQAARNWSKSREDFPPELGKLRGGKNGNGRFETAFDRAAVMAWLHKHGIPLRDPAVREISMLEAAKHYGIPLEDFRDNARTDPDHPQAVRKIPGDHCNRLQFFDQNQLDIYYAVPRPRRIAKAAGKLVRETSSINSMARQFLASKPMTSRAQ